MKDLLLKIKTPLIVVAVLFVAFFFYNSFIKKPVSNNLLEKTVQGPANDTIVKNILPLLTKIKDITLDDKFFSDPIFMSLQDFGQQIVEEEQGRANPFAPSFSAAASSSLEGVGFEDVSMIEEGAILPSENDKPALIVPTKKK